MESELMPPLPPVLALALLTMIGWLAGCLANLAADELPRFRADRDESEARESSIARPRTPSALLHHLTLPWYAARRGICPHCSARLPVRAPLLELATALAFPLVWARLGQQPLHAAIVCVYAAFLLAVLVIDLEHRLVLNVMVAPAALLALAASFLPGGPSPTQALLGGILAFAAFFVLALAGRGALGFGDVKLAGVIGLMVGYPAVITALFAGVLLGGAGAAILMVARKATRKTAIAYAPYLVLGALAAILVRGTI
jgi:leader peptidase (prepilin peptidase)/N-methyltransferase